MFEKNDEKVTFKMPHKMKRFKDIEDLNTNNIPPFSIASKGDKEKGKGYVSRKGMTYYSECLKLGPEYKRDEGIIKTIKILNERSSSKVAADKDRQAAADFKPLWGRLIT
ncbi:hypothetical protein Tco_0295357 [Tanacetum coccineum]